MTDDQQATMPGVDFVVSLAELEAAQINAVLDDIQSLDSNAIGAQLLEHAHASEGEKRRALMLMWVVLQFDLDLDDPRDAFKPAIRLGGQHSLSPHDIQDEQLIVLSHIAPHFSNPAVRATVADIIWTRFPQALPFADLAVSSYCECIERLGATHTADIAPDAMSAPPHLLHVLLVRVATISRVTALLLPSCARLSALMSKIVLEPCSNIHTPTFITFATIALQYMILAPADIARSTRDIALRDHEHICVDSLMSLWNLAAAGYYWSDDQDNYRSSALQYGDCLISKVHQATSAQHKAMYLTDAIRLLEAMSGDQEKLRQLRHLLKDTEANLVDEIRLYALDPNYQEYAKLAVEVVSGTSLSNCLLCLILCSVIPQHAKLQNQATTLVRQSSFLMDAEIKTYDFQKKKDAPFVTKPTNSSRANG